MRIYPYLYKTFKIYSRHLNLATVTIGLMAQEPHHTTDNAFVLVTRK
jgi:hypothetical protein